MKKNMRIFITMLIDIELETDDIPESIHGGCEDADDIANATINYFVENIIVSTPPAEYGIKSELLPGGLSFSCDTICVL